MEIIKKNKPDLLINELYLIVLRKNPIKIDRIEIKKYFENEKLDLRKHCFDKLPHANNLLKFLMGADSLKELSGKYKYCDKLNDSFVEFEVDCEKSIQNLSSKIDDIKKENEDIPWEEIKEIKKSLYENYEFWIKAYSIQKAYEACQSDETIIIYSHRTAGWSNPIYQLTPNFSVEVLTNFGYGKSSYFFTKLKYKNIEITPFSEWINYRFVKASQLLRYSKRHNLKNADWENAMKFAKDACDLSISDESKFVKKYIIEECELMATGLENFFINDSFNFNEGEKMYKTDLGGHALIEFRGEKITGALEFISKIMEFNKVASIQSFIRRIESLNKKIGPILEQELPKIKMTIESLNQEKKDLQPKYDEAIKKNKAYNKKINVLSRQKEFREGFDPSLKESFRDYLLREFQIKNPEYESFKHEYDTVTKEFYFLVGEIRNNNQILANIKSYDQRQKKYFQDKS